MESQKTSVFTRPLSLLLLVGSIAACDHAARAPLAPELSASDARGVTPVRGGITPLDTATKVCRPGDLPGLTEQQIEEIRALYAAFNAAVAEDLRWIAIVEKQAREAAAAGAPRERIEQILAQADAAKRDVAEAEQRLRQAISDVLNEEQRRRHCTVIVVPARPNG